MNGNVSILIIDDEQDMRNLLEMYLENSGFTCFQAENGKEALECLKTHTINLILLDIMMPKDDGFIVCGNIRKVSAVPIIFLSAKGEEWDKVRGLQIGGDDYIVKPFNPGELIARINAVLRRTNPIVMNANKKVIGEINVDLNARKIMVHNQQIQLTLKEYELLLFFISHEGQALSREQLLEQIWGIDYLGSLRTVDTHVKTLRMKLRLPQYIQTVWGIGYKFEVTKC